MMHIVGRFKELKTFTAGGLAWHKSASRFVGSGVSDRDVLISYSGYWDGPGRWSAEFITTENRYIFRPMEKLQIQKIGSVMIEFDDFIDYSVDEDFKPGLYLQTEAFLSEHNAKLCTIDDQVLAFSIYNEIANYQ